MNFVRFGLIVTGKGEERFLPKLFRAIQAGANCIFEVIQRSPQLRPITSTKRQQEVRKKNKKIPTKDEDGYGIPARLYLQKHDHSFVLVIDDLEHDGREIVQEIFQRYRTALDTLLAPQNLQQRASVHFLVNMLEAYYFGDSKAVNAVAGRLILEKDHEGDVEEIRHPKNDFRERFWREFNEIEHGEKILDQLDLDLVLSNGTHCCFLRTLIDWCIQHLGASKAIFEGSLSSRFELSTGMRAEVTGSQLPARTAETNENDGNSGDSAEPPGEPPSP